MARAGIRKLQCPHCGRVFRVFSGDVYNLQGTCWRCVAKVAASWARGIFAAERPQQGREGKLTGGVRAMLVPRGPSVGGSRAVPLSDRLERPVGPPECVTGPAPPGAGAVLAGKARSRGAR